MRATNPGFVPDSPFQRRLTPEWLEFFETFPKAELHCHLLGTIRKETFEDLVRESNAPVTQAEIDAKLRINCLKNAAAAAEERLRKGKEELEKFSAAVRAVCDKEIQLLNELPQAPVELPQEEAKPEDSVQEIEDSVMAAFSEAAPEEDGDTAETQTEASEPVAEATDPAAATSDPFGDFPDLSSTRQINLDELKFGRNYNT